MISTPLASGAKPDPLGSLSAGLDQSLSNNSAHAPPWRSLDNCVERGERQDQGSHSRTNAQWTVVFEDTKWGCRVRHLPCPWPTEVKDQLYEMVHNGTPWQQLAGMPRKTAWLVAGGCTCKYAYGKFQVGPQAFPAWMDEILSKIMPLLGIENKSGWPDSCNLNLYKDGNDGVGWHADDEALFQGTQQKINIISLSLGAARTFQLKGTWQGASVEQILLHHGDLCTMEGFTQKYYVHKVPREFAQGARINLTWRWVVKHLDSCAIQQSGAPSGETLDGISSPN